MILTDRQIAVLLTFACVVVAQRFEVHQTCSPNPLVASRAVCASVSQAARIYGPHNPTRLQSHGMGPSIAKKITASILTEQSRSPPWVILSTTAEAALSLKSYFHIVPNEQPLSASEPYCVAELPGKGRGLIANRTIYQEERNIAGDAILAFHIDAHLQLPPDKRRPLDDLVLENLPSEAREEFLSQVGKDVTTVIERNSFKIHTGRNNDAVRYVGAFP